MPSAYLLESIQGEGRLKKKGMLKGSLRVEE